jgi:thioredoxin-related protein
MHSYIKLFLVIIITGCFTFTVMASQDYEQAELTDFDDALLKEELVYPDWFKISLGDLNDDLQESLDEGKSGLIVYFGQKRCAYCEQFLEANLDITDIQKYIREHYNIVPIDIWGIEDIKDTDGKSYTERELSIRYKTNFTPSLVFYDDKGKPVFRLRGYYPPYKFRAALKYVVEGFYKKETFREYLARAESGMFFMLGGLNERDFFIKPPYNLKQVIKESENPLVVFFEQGKCHACDLLHTGPLNKKDTIDEIGKMNAVQLDMWSDTPLVTPGGKKTTARAWAEDLDLFYAPTLVFFDTDEKEIIRLDSVVKFYRLLGVLDYMNKRGYATDDNYQTWRIKRRKTN